MSQPLIELRGLSFAYPGGASILDHVDFALLPGETVALTGANGSGKTTLFRIVLGLLKPDRGEVFAFGEKRRREEDFFEVRERVGLLFQDPDDQLFCPTVLEDVCFGPLNLGLSRRDAERVASQTLRGLGLQGYEDKMIHRLSGGEKRLVSLAAVLAMSPKVLLLDEPSNDLDENARERLIAILRDLALPMIVVSHDRDFLEKTARRVVHLKNGRVETAVASAV